MKRLIFSALSAVLVSGFLVFLGLFMNDLVMSMNGGKMPVFNSHQCSVTVETVKYTRGNENTKLPLLADRFVERNSNGDCISIASIGDYVMIIGGYSFTVSILFIIVMSPLFLVWIMWTTYIKFFSKEKQPV